MAVVDPLPGKSAVVASPMLPESDHSREDSAAAPASPPLVVPVEGVMLQCDLLAEALASMARRQPLDLLLAPWLALRGGRMAIFARPAVVEGISELGPLLREPVLEYLRKEVLAGRRLVFLAPEPIAARRLLDPHFPGCEILGPEDGLPSGGRALAEALVARFGERGFDFLGGPRATHPALAVARKAMAAIRDDRSGHLKGARRHAADVQVVATLEGTTWKDWVRELRFHQWAKNLLILVPFLSGHHYAGAYQMGGLVAAIIAMGLCASATYLWNDILDVEFDRRHARKQHRLLASGRTSLGRAFGTSVFLLGPGLLGGFLLDIRFGAILVFYVALTVAYSVHLKRIALVDLFVLTSLYLTRIVAGIVVGGALVSFWLFAFSFLFFLSLAAAKRRIEIRLHPPASGEKVRGRGYAADDGAWLTALGISTGVGATLMLALYSESEHVHSLYHQPAWLWGACVLCLFWINRVWLLTERGQLDDDPVLFALRDRATLVVAACGALVFHLAQPI